MESFELVKRRAPRGSTLHVAVQRAATSWRAGKNDIVPLRPGTLGAAGQRRICGRNTVLYIESRNTPAAIMPA
ncbi:hypothetical protein [Caballeronia sordidicola]|uniref:hypothetical protein n=1 Tax=Caballeronia TaxID=1827195 RepID=UPI000764C71E|nr:hypothetical protein [Caballeronia sordidicola]